MITIKSRSECICGNINDYMSKSYVDNDEHLHIKPFGVRLFLQLHLTATDHGSSDRSLNSTW